MKILLAGATGAIGRPLLTRLSGAGHEVFALVRPRAGADAKRGLPGEVRPVMVDALDRAAVADAVAQTKPDAIVNELTSLPAHYTPEEMRDAAIRDKELRVNGQVNLLMAASAAKCSRYVLQSTGFWYAPGPGLADESESFAFEASPGIAAGCRTYADLESTAQGSGLAVSCLRYGFFYGPGTWFSPDGDVGEQVRRGAMPVIGSGAGVWSWLHIEDAADATFAALTAEPGVYNVADDAPVPQAVWLRAFAKFVDAPEPPTVPEEEALRTSGADSVYYAMKLRGASNEKAKREFAFRPRPLAWLPV